MTYLYTIKTNDTDTIGSEGFETTNFDSAMIIYNALSRDELVTVTMTTQLI